jgi:hypothetical protein
VFNEKIWRKNFFTHTDQIAAECKRFNSESLEYFHYKYAQLLFNSNYPYIESDHKIETDKLLSLKNKKIFFLRFVESPEKNKIAYINILNELIALPEKYNHQFVFVELNIEKEKLYIYSEFEKTVTLIMEHSFNLNI